MYIALTGDWRRKPEKLPRYLDVSKHKIKTGPDRRAAPRMRVVAAANVLRICIRSLLAAAAGLLRACLGTPVAKLIRHQLFVLLPVVG